MTASLADTVQRAILADISSSLEGTARSATFAVGGSIPIKVLVEDAGTSDDAVVHTAPVTIRFGQDGCGRKIVLPVVQDNATASTHHSGESHKQTVSCRLGELVAACSPASFGRNGEDVHDETYRKAGKLDTDAFLTSFCPYETDIVSMLTQLLAPSPSRTNEVGSLRAELYKLNVYSGPSGMFKPHVDTPRSTDQVGSLVVCLPVEHEGGDLVVRHAGREVIFDWSANSHAEPLIQWAAFYSDCEHEVLEVTAGHRITLTYNLYATRAAPGFLVDMPVSVNAQQLPLYQTLASALECPSFLPGGKVMAIHLTHSYGHTTKDNNFLPWTLKGADMSLYVVSRELGLDCFLRPVIKGLERSHWDEGRGDWEYEENATFLGSRFQPFASVDGQEEEPTFNVVQRRLSTNEEWQEDKIVWLNHSSDHEKPQLAFTAYGNDAYMNVVYSQAIMLIRVPPFNDRSRGNCNISSETSASGRIFAGLSSDGQDGAAQHTAIVIDE